jgi:hypothetical protein
MRSILVVDMGSLEDSPYFIPAAQLFEVVLRFWRDFLRYHGPYDGIVPVGKTKLSDEA